MKVIYALLLYILFSTPAIGAKVYIADLSPHTATSFVNPRFYLIDKEKYILEVPLKIKCAADAQNSLVLSIGKYKIAKDSLIFTDNKYNIRLVFIAHNGSYISLQCFPFLENKRFNLIDSEYNFQGHIKTLIIKNQPAPNVDMLAKPDPVIFMDNYSDYAQLVTISFQPNNKYIYYIHDLGIFSKGTFVQYGQYILLKDEHFNIAYYLKVENKNKLTSIIFPGYNDVEFLRLQH